MNKYMDHYHRNHIQFFLVPNESKLMLAFRKRDGKYIFYKKGSLLQVNIGNHAHVFQIMDKEPSKIESNGKFDYDEIDLIENLEPFMEPTGFVDTGFTLATSEKIFEDKTRYIQKTRVHTNYFGNISFNS